MPEQDEGVYYFAGFCVDAVRRRLSHNGSSISITSKAFETLVALIRHRGETVSKTDLMNAIWADTAVEENNLTQQISALRRALGETPGEHRYIVTVPGNGYCFVATVGHEPQSYRLVLPGQETARWKASHGIRVLDPAVIRGYSVALVFMAAICLGFLWSGVRNMVTGRSQSLAVLSFKVATADDAFIGDGISDTLRARLGSVQDLTVRPGAFALSDVDAISAGRRLKVDTVVTGSVQRDHDRLRVVVEMLDVGQGTIVWGKTFDESASNVFDLQDSIASEVARVLKIGYTSHSRIHASSGLFSAGYIRPRENFSV
ncbi:MAG: winged helix-turn-helix domain-containing protein [Acidobacteriota bacterium]